MLLSLCAATLWAHHSFDAEFDRNKVVELKGTVIKMEWVNPHAMIHIAVKNDDGTTSTWMIEGNTPNSLLRLGLTKKALAEGTELVVRGYRARSGENFASASAMLFKDGTKLAVTDGESVLDWISRDEELWKRQIKVLRENNSISGK
jgi:hypothetical protein